MEVEFDKEIDALLRRDSGGRTITIGEFAGGHPDADEIAAFVERAMPESTRLVMTNHFADCDPCRRVLSNAIALGLEDTSALEEKASAAPIVTALPWYRRLFQFPQLAYTLGGLVVLFAGFIGVSVMFNSQRDGTFEMSRTAANQPVSSEDRDISASANTNAAGNAAASANTASNSVTFPMMPAEAVPADSNSARSAETSRQGPALAEDDRELSRPEPKATVMPDPGEKRARAEEQPADVTVRQERATVPSLENERKVETLRSVPAAAPPPAPAKAAPMTQDAPRDKQAADTGRAARKETPAGANTVTVDRKQFRDKTFEFRQGAWYDTTYRGQGTINVRRNTEAYRKLDRGLRSLAENFIGTVVTIWNGKAYRID